MRVLGNSRDLVSFFAGSLDFISKNFYLCSILFHLIIYIDMAVTRNNLSMKMKGRVGAYTFYTTNGGRQVARIANNGSNYGESAKRTVAMQTRRTKWGNLVTFYRMNRDLMARAFERKDVNISDYNRFMQLNVPFARVALTKDAFMRGVCILQEYVVSDGSLPGFSATVEETGEISWDLKSSLDGEFQDYTIGQVSEDLIKNNPTLQKGDQLTFVSWTNAGAVDSLPRLYRHLCELTLDPVSSVSFGTLLSANIVGATEGRVQILGQGPVYGQVIILSRVVSGNLLVSRSQIALSSEIFVQQFSEPDAVKKAIDSYGVDVEKLLEPGSDEQPAPKPMPGLVSISVVAVPSESGIVTIHNNETEESAVNFLQVPVGSKVYLSHNADRGFEFVSYNPPFVDQEVFEVNSNLVITANFRNSSEN